MAQIQTPGALLSIEHFDSFAGFAACGILAALLSLIASPEQALLGAAMPAGCLFCLASDTDEEGEAERPAWMARAIFFLAGTAVALALWRWQLGPWILTDFALFSAALQATPIPWMLPLSDFLPWCALLAIVLGVVLGGEEAHSAAGLAVGRVTGFPLLWACICIVISTAALVAWSLWWVKGNHGPIQEVLGPQLSPALVVLFALVNGLAEEIEFRMLVFGGLLAQPASHPLLWLPWAICSHSVLFAALHVAAGFPSGLSGGFLVLTWSVFLGIMRYWTGGMALVFLLHVQADIVVFSLIFREDKRRRSIGSEDSSSDAPER